jgi:hypothetical protein
MLLEVTAVADQPEKEKPPIKEIFRFKAVKKPLEESSLHEGQTISVTPLGSDARLIAMIKRTSPDQLRLEFPKPIAEIPLKIGGKLRLKFWDYYEATRCDSEIIQVSGPRGNDVMVSRPREGETMERKRSRAVYHKILVSLRVTEAIERELIGQKEADLEAKQLTLTGLECKTNLPLQQNDKLELTLQLPPDQELSTMAKVVASQKVEEEGKILCSADLQFVDLGARRYNRLALFLALTVSADSVEDIFWTG